MKIEVHTVARGATDERKWSVVIPTWNNLDYAKLCVRSLRQNSAFRHQIILHINEGSDGTREWARAEGLDFSASDENIGVCLATNLAASLATESHVVYANDDMYFLPGWDMALDKRVGELGDQLFFLSATMIEPLPTRSKPVIGGKGFGTDLASFDEARLLREYASFEKPDWYGATRPPNMVRRDLWNLVGGLSVEFSPGMYSDPDFSRKLWHVGVRIFEGVSASRVYHFACKTTGRVKHNKGCLQFMKKWGVTSSAFYKYCIRKGDPLGREPLVEPKGLRWRMNKLKVKLRTLFT